MTNEWRSKQSDDLELKDTESRLTELRLAELKYAESRSIDPSTKTETEELKELFQYVISLAKNRITDPRVDQCRRGEDLARIYRFETLFGKIMFK